MKSPLLKRLPYLLKKEFIKYLIIFIFMTSSIGLISGFLVADGSMIKAYDESFEKYNIEDGHFRLKNKLTNLQKEILENENVKITNMNYFEEKSDSNLIRIYKNRKDVNKVCLMSGKMPVKKTEIAIDRMYAVNNNYQVGDIIKIADKEMKIVGLVALSDYSALFSNNNDLMFDAVKFSVAIVSNTGYQYFDNKKINYNYAWSYTKNIDDEITEANNFMHALVNNVKEIKEFTPQYANQAICFTGDDMSGDKMLMVVLLYIIIVILAFVFAITTKNTIESEATMAGTLKAMGYTKYELLIHYLTLPLLVSLLSCIVGNILGYSYFKDIMANLYYSSYSLPTYVTIFSLEAFITTTIIPFIIMLIINISILNKTLSINTLRLMKRDFKKNKDRKTIVLHRLNFLSQFRFSVIINNLSGYLTLFFGILFSVILLMFGMDMKPILNHYQDLVVDNMIAKYQYVLNVPELVNRAEIEEVLDVVLKQDKDIILKQVDNNYKELFKEYQTTNTNVEAFSLYTLKTTSLKEEEISIYGIKDNSKYIKINKLPKKGVYISKDLADKYRLTIGDSISLKESYQDIRYSFLVKGIYNSPGNMTIYMSNDYFNEIFKMPKGYFNGYFSNSKITDLDDKIAMTITEDDYTKVSRQLNVSMGDMFYIVEIFAIVMFVILIYLLTKMVIENNRISISMVKILGYTNKEIKKIYIHATTIVVIISTLLSFVLATWLLSYLFVIVFSEYPGWLPFYIDINVYLKMFVLMFISYTFVVFIQIKKINRIKMDDILKVTE